MRAVDFGGGPLTSRGSYDIFLARYDAAGNHLWSQSFGDAGLVNDHRGKSVAIDASGNVIVTGDFEGTIDFGGGPLTSAGNHDIFVAKFDADGNHIWSRKTGNGLQQLATAIATDAYGNVFITGAFYNASGANVNVVKYDADGNLTWSRSFGDAESQIGNGIATDGLGNVVVTGWFAGSMNFGGGSLVNQGGADIFVAKLDADGNHIWSRRFGDANPQHDQNGLSVTTDAAADVIVTGFMNGTVDFGGGPLVGNYDVYIAKFDAAGNHIWSQRFGDLGSAFGFGVAADVSADVIVTGRFSGTVDFGGGPLTSADLDDIFVAKFDADGNHIWSQRFGETGRQCGNAIATDASGNVVLTGEFEGGVNFDGEVVLESAGYTDIFLARLEVHGFVPTMLQEFDVQYRTEEVELIWRLSEIGRDARFFVLRSEGSDLFAELHSAPVEIDGLNGAFTDRVVEPGKTYRYRVDVSDEDGRQVLFTTQEITVPVAALTLGPVQPNPFNPQTTIHFTVPEAAQVRLVVYDTQGKLVRTLVDGAVPAGARSIAWNGRDNRGGPVPSGVYFVRLESGKQVRTTKIVLLK